MCARFTYALLLLTSGFTACSTIPAEAPHHSSATEEVEVEVSDLDHRSSSYRQALTQNQEPPEIPVEETLRESAPAEVLTVHCTKDAETPEFTKTIVTQPRAATLRRKTLCERCFDRLTACCGCFSCGEGRSDRDYRQSRGSFRQSGREPYSSNTTVIIIDSNNDNEKSAALLCISCCQATGQGCWQEILNCYEGCNTASTNCCEGCAGFVTDLCSSVANGLGDVGECIGRACEGFCEVLASFDSSDD